MFYQNVVNAAKEAGLDDEVSLEHSKKELPKYGALFAPALVVDGELLSEGKSLELQEIIKLLEKV